MENVNFAFVKSPVDQKNLKHGVVIVRICQKIPLSWQHALRNSNFLAPISCKSTPYQWGKLNQQFIVTALMDLDFLKNFVLQVQYSKSTLILIHRMV